MDPYFLCYCCLNVSAQNALHARRAPDPPHDPSRSPLHVASNDKTTAGMDSMHQLTVPDAGSATNLLVEDLSVRPVARRSSTGSISADQPASPSFFAHHRHIRRYHSPTRSSSTSTTATATPHASRPTDMPPSPASNVHVDLHAAPTNNTTTTTINTIVDGGDEHILCCGTQDPTPDHKDSILLFSGDEYSAFPDHIDLHGDELDHYQDECQQNTPGGATPRSSVDSEADSGIFSSRRRHASISAASCKIACSKNGAAQSPFALEKSKAIRQPYLVHHVTCTAHCAEAREPHSIHGDYRLLRPQDLCIPRSFHRPVRTYLFGYGSLINPQSRLRTLPEPTVALPVIVKNLHRSWSYNCTCRSYTAVGVTRCKGSLCNGVLIPIKNPMVELPRLDEREKDYVRSRICPADILLLNSFRHFIDEDEDAIVWVYELGSGKPSVSSASECVVGSDFRYPVQKIPESKQTDSMEEVPHSPSPPIDIQRQSSSESTLSEGRQLSSKFRRHKVHNKIVYLESGEHTPTLTVPIPQTYVDCILTGCFIYGRSFAEAFVKTTCGWNGVWVNDRHVHDGNKRYVRCAEIGETWTFEEQQMDDVLKKCVGEAFRNRLPWSALTMTVPNLKPATIATRSDSNSETVIQAASSPVDIFV